MIQLIFSTTLLSVRLYHGGGAYSSANFTDGNILLTERTSKIKFT